MKSFTISSSIFAAFAVALSTPAVAQNNGPVIIGAQQAESFLRTGTPVVLSLSEELSTKGKKLRAGQRVRFQVSEPVMAGGMIVIPAGSPAVGELTDIRNKGMWGKSGKINGRLISVSVNGRSIRLSGSFDDKGVTGTAGVIGAVAFVPVAGFFMTGTSAKLPIGTVINGFIDEDVPLVIRSAAPVDQPITSYQNQNVAPKELKKDSENDESITSHTFRSKAVRGD